MSPKKSIHDAVPTFSGEEFFRPGEKFYIHMSNSLPEFVGVPHKHKFIEIVYVISGKAEHRTSHFGVERSYEVEKGDLVIINYETTHAFYAIDCGEPFISYDLMFTPDFLDPSLFSDAMFESLSSSLLFYSMFPDEETLGPDLRLSGSGYAAFGELFGRIYLEYTAGESGYANMIRACIVELVVMILRRMGQQAARLEVRQEELVSSAIEYLSEHYRTQVSLEDLASKVFLSKDYFGRLFKDVTGMTFVAYLTQYRISEACRLLATTNEKIVDIALECGYNDTKNFYKCFRRLVGMTPGDYRRASSTQSLTDDADNEEEDEDCDV